MFRLLIISLSLMNTLMGVSSWKLPHSSRRYNEVCFLTSHNSYASKKHGYYYAQQSLSLEEQLNAGVRGFMLDTWLDRKKNVVLCHRGESLTRLICMGKSPEHLTTALKPFKLFLEKNPHEVLTFFLENYVSDNHLLDNAFKQAGLEKFILNPSAYDPQDEWPTLDWMQKNNKRLVIFNATAKTNLAFNQWEHVVENQWGALQPARASKERSESRMWRNKKRHLFVVNYFPMFRLTFGDPYKYINTEGLRQCMDRILVGLDTNYCDLRFPNFLSLDYIEKGDALNYVNAINTLTLEDEKRSLFFRSVQQ